MTPGLAHTPPVQVLALGGRGDLLRWVLPGATTAHVLSLITLNNWESITRVYAGASR